jgi:hypothetical protein
MKSFDDLLENSRKLLERSSLLYNELRNLSSRTTDLLARAEDIIYLALKRPDRQNRNIQG